MPGQNARHAGVDGFLRSRRQCIEGIRVDHVAARITHEPGAGIKIAQPAPQMVARPGSGEFLREAGVAANRAGQRGFIDKKQVVDQFIDVVGMREQVHHVHLMGEDHQRHHIARWRQRKLRIEYRLDLAALRICKAPVTHVARRDGVSRHKPAAPKLTERRSAIDIDLAGGNSIGS